MNLDELELLHRAVEGGYCSAPELGDALQRAFPALLALARDGERYRTTRLLASRGKLPPEWWEGFTERELDAAIDAARKGEK